MVIKNFCEYEVPQPEGLIDLDVILHDHEPTREEIEARVFFLKLKADLLRYLCEVADPITMDERQTAATAAYEEAYKIEINLANPVRLSLVFNYAIYLGEVQDKPADSIAMVEKAIADH